jgi:hypothetical protein
VTESPSALLERAAEMIQRRTTWNFPTDVPTSCSRCTPAPRCLCIEAPGPSTLWLATMPRDAASPLVEWLRHAALAYRMDGDSSQDERALAFARIVLGEPE